MNEQIARILIDLLKLAKLSSDPDHRELIQDLERRVIELGVDLSEIYNTQSGAW